MLFIFGMAASVVEARGGGGGGGGGGAGVSGRGGKGGGKGSPEHLANVPTVCLSDMINAASPAAQKILRLGMDEVKEEETHAPPPVACISTTTTMFQELFRLVLVLLGVAYALACTSHTLLLLVSVHTRTYAPPECGLA